MPHSAWFTDLAIAFRSVFRKKISWLFALAGTAALGWIFFWLLYQVTTVPEFFRMMREGAYGNHSYLYASLYWSSTVVTLLLFGISTAFVAHLARRKKFNERATGAGVAGALLGAFGAACPVCGAFLLSLIGITGGLAVFPLQGLEFKFVSLILVAGSLLLVGRQVTHMKEQEGDACPVDPVPEALKTVPLEKIITPILIVVFLLNQFLISSMSVALGASSNGSVIGTLFGIKTAAAKVIIAPKLNPDGRTTSLVEQPTITDVPANPNTGDALADAKAVMLAAGKPFYAPGDISFDDPVNAQKKWGAFEDSIQLSGALDARYQILISTMTCSYCCGSAGRVTLNKQCGCAHARAVRGFYKYMLQTYGEAYTNEQLIGESHRWYALWYPKGMLEDYLLATGKSDALPHESHGGAGSNGHHGL